MLEFEVHDYSRIIKCFIQKLKSSFFFYSRKF